MAASWGWAASRTCVGRLQLPTHKQEVEQEPVMNSQDTEMQQQGDSIADAITAVVLIAVFIATCMFWVSGH